MAVGQIWDPGTQDFVDVESTGSTYEVRVTEVAEGGLAWTPLDLPDLVAGYDGVLSPITSSGSPAKASACGDLVNDFDLIQADGALQPNVNVETIGLRNAISFVKASNTKLVAAGVTIAQPFTVLTRVRLNSLADGQILGNFTDPEATIFVNGGKWSLYAGSVADTATTADAAEHQLIVVFNGATSKFYLDNVDISPAGNPGAAGRTDIALGADNGANSFDGPIQSAYFMEGIITAADRALWNAYCAQEGVGRNTVEVGHAGGKLGVLGAVPVVRQAHIADADLTNVHTKFNTLLDYLEAFGFVATS